MTPLGPRGVSRHGWCRLGVCKPEAALVRRTVTALGAMIVQQHGLVEVHGGIIERGSRAFEQLRVAHPAHPCWPLLERRADLVLVVAVADAPVLN